MEAGRVFVTEGLWQVGTAVLVLGTEQPNVDDPVPAL